MSQKFDILFLGHEKDKDVLKKSLEYAKKNVLGYRRIFLLSKENFFPQDDKIDFVSENNFPFDKREVGKYCPKGRAGWYYQQFLKLYFFEVMGKKVLDNVLVIDADTIFLKKVSFFEKGKPLYNVEKGHHEPYYKVMEKIFGFGKVAKFSGITHHMMFQRKYLKEILREGSKDTGKEFWKVVLENINTKTISGFSEYDLYFNYMIHKYPNEIKIRKLRFIDFPHYSEGWLNFFKFLGYKYLSAHDYLKEEKFPVIKSIFLDFLKRIGLRNIIKQTFIKMGIIKRK